MNFSHAANSVMSNPIYKWAVIIVVVVLAFGVVKYVSESVT